MNPSEILERANFSMTFGIIVTIVGIVLKQFIKRPDYSSLKGKSHSHILKTGAKLIFYNRAQGFLFLGISLVLFATVFYIWYLLA